MVLPDFPTSSAVPRSAIRAALAAAIALLAIGLVPASAQAKHGQPLLFDTGARLLVPQTRDATFAELQDLGVDGVRIAVSWRSVAPDPTGQERPSGNLSDPAAYDLSQVAAAVEGAKARGWKVVLTVSSPVPRWGTEGARDTLTNPRPSDFQHFMTALGRRLGPSVDWWAIWNEPNLFKFLLPQYLKGKPAAPLLYRRLFLAARAGLDAADLPKARMLMGETAPRGNGRDRIAPLAFLRGVLCLDAHYKRRGSCARLPADGYAHHPYTTPAGPFFVPTQVDDVTMGAMGRLESALDKAARAGAVKKRLPVFITEFGVQSYPDRSLGVPLDRQADFRSIAERMSWSDPRIAAFSQYLLEDDQPALDQPPARRYPGFESGIKTAAGKRKPVYEGFRLPLTAQPTRAGVTLWGLVRPATGATRVTVQRADRGGSFRTVFTVKTKSDGSWTAKTSNRSGRTWRVVWADPDGVTHTGPRTKAYSDPR